MRINKYFYILLLGLGLILLNQTLLGQNTLFFQGFESSSADNWTFSGGNVNTETARTGTLSLRIGRNGESNTATFDCFNLYTPTGCYTNLQLQIFMSIRSGSGPGMDTREGAVIQINTNCGATWTTIGQIGGNSDHSVAWSSATIGLTNTCSQTYTSPNPLNYSIPAATTSIRLRVLSIKGGPNTSDCAPFGTNMDSANPTPGNYDRADEGFFIDDVRITTTTNANPTVTGLSAMTSACGNFVVNWTDVACENGYDVEVHSNATFSALVASTSVGASVTSATFTGIPTGNYWYRVRAKGTWGLSYTWTGSWSTAGSVSHTGVGSGPNYTWTGAAGDGNWSNCANWSTFTVPVNDGTANVTIPTTTAANRLNLSTVPTMTLLNNFIANTNVGFIGQIGNSATATFEVDNLLTLDNGVVFVNQTNGSKVYVSNPATGAITSHSVRSYVRGNLERAVVINASAPVYNFPVGGEVDGSAIPTGTGKGYQLIRFAFSGTVINQFNTMTRLMVSFDETNGAHPTPSATECGTNGYTAFIGNGRWIVTSSPSSFANPGHYGAVAFPRNFTAAYAGGSTNYTPITGNIAVTLAKRPNSSMAWALDGVCAPGLTNSNLNAVPPIITRNTITNGFSEFIGIVDHNTPFPVAGVTLKATLNQDTKQAALSWDDNQKENTLFYVIEQSNDSLTFNNRNNYFSNAIQSTFEPLPENAKTIYYRVRVVKQDGSIEYSNVSALTIAQENIENNIEVSLYPNPVQDVLTLRLPQPHQTQIALYNAAGQLVFEAQFDKQQVITVDMRSFSSGIYVAKVNSANQIRYLKVVKS